MAEKWRRVPSEPGVLASSLGRILLPPSYVPLPNGGYRAFYPKPRYGSVTKSSAKAAHEYMGVMIKSDGANRQAPRKVHRLVCEAFHGAPPFEGAVVIHIDENAKNNRPENLKWGTQKENLNMPMVKEWHRSRVGDASPATIGRHKRELAAMVLNRLRHYRDTGLSTEALMVDAVTEEIGETNRRAVQATYDKHFKVYGP